MPVLAAILAGGSAYLAASAHPPPYVATGSVALPAGDAANADARVTQALTIAQILAEDEHVQHALAARTGRSATDLVGDYAVEIIDYTTVIRLTYVDRTAGRAAAGLRALAAIVTARPSIAPGVPDGALVVTRVRDAPVLDGTAPDELAGIGLLAGLVLGGVLAVARDRQHP
jgi:hypothetical protein